jgi:hypothetical protein
VLANQQRLVRLIDILRDRGHPTPSYRAVGEAAGQAYTLQQMAPGETLEPAPGRAGLEWTAIYLCHLILRQLEWSIRHRPGSAEVTRFWCIANAILDDISGRPRPG